MGSLSKTNQNVQEVVQEVLFQEVDQVVAPLDALSVVRQAPDDEGVPGELRGHPQGGYLRSPAPQAHDGRLRRLPPAAVWRLLQRRWLPRPTTAPSTAPLPRPPCPTLPPCPTAPTAPPTTAPTAPPTKVVHTA